LKSNCLSPSTLLLFFKITLAILGPLNFLKNIKSSYLGTWDVFQYSNCLLLLWTILYSFQGLPYVLPLLNLFHFILFDTTINQIATLFCCFYFCLFVFLCFLRQGPSLYSRLDSNFNPPASDTQVLGLQSCTATPSQIVFLFSVSKWSLQAGCWWLMLIILATQEAEIRRIEVWSQPRKIVHKTLSQKIPNTKKGLAEGLE
jgi:hypothetical protein